MASTHIRLLLLLLAVVAVSAQRNYTILRNITITTTLGPVRGGVIETSGPEDGTVVHIGSFLGINFAKVPTGEFRFAHPVFTQFDFVQDAVTFDQKCFQDPGTGDFNNMAENCIAANIWTPYNGTSTTPGSYPVLVWIHGGRFESGSIVDESTSGRVLTSHERIVTVSLQSRLGVLGFLRLSSTVVPGNMGLKDQALGLEFVHNNIERFGGNLETVTLMGIDSGAASIGYHMLNEKTRTFFKRAIMLGGSPMVFWSVRQNTANVERLHMKFAKDQLNCDVDKGVEEVFKCLRDISPQRLINAQKEFTSQFQGVEFPPVIDGDYIKEDPVQAFRAGKFQTKQLMIGNTNSEAALYIESALEQRKWTKEDLADPAKFRALLEDNFRTYEREPDLLSAHGRQFMTDRFTSFGDPSAEKNFRRWLDAASDRLFVCPTNEFADLVHSVPGQSSDIYSYVFSEQDDFTINYQGASHGRDAYYFFGNPSDDAPIVKPEQKLLADRMMDYLAKFVANGDPVPRDGDRVWAKYNATHKYFHNFSSEAEYVYNVPYGFHRDECGFWDKTLKYTNSLQSANPLQVRVARETSANDASELEAEKCKNVVNSTTIAIMVPLLTSNVVLLGALTMLLVKYCGLPSA